MLFSFTIVIYPLISVPFHVCLFSCMFLIFAFSFYFFCIRLFSFIFENSFIHFLGHLHVRCHVVILDPPCLLILARC